MSDIRQHYEACRKHFGPNPVIDFLLAHARSYSVSPHSYSGRRGVIKQCYMNATRLVIRCPWLTYVEGKVTCYGVPIDHAWCVDRDGIVIDPTARKDEDGFARIGEYFGVPFLREYVRRATLLNDCYGLLDWYHARKTMPKLYELGLEAGQQWLLDQPERGMERA